MSNNFGGQKVSILLHSDSHGFLWVVSRLIQRTMDYRSVYTNSDKERIDGFATPSNFQSRKSRAKAVFIVTCSYSTNSYLLSI